MEKSVEQLEKNVSASFGYVKKDMMMLNDSFSDLNDKIQHISLNQATILEQINELRKAVEGKKVKKTVKKKVKKEKLS